MNCVETWADETGHDETTHQHHCGRPAGAHSRHLCLCGAETWEASS